MIDMRRVYDGEQKCWTNELSTDDDDDVNRRPFRERNRILCIPASLIGRQSLSRRQKKPGMRWMRSEPFWRTRVKR